MNGVSQLEAEVIAGLIAIVPIATAAVIALLQTYVNKQAIKERPTHAQVSDKIQTAVNDALASNAESNKGVSGT